MRNIRSISNLRLGIPEAIPAWSKAICDNWVGHHSNFVDDYDALACYTIAPDKRQMAVVGRTSVGKRATMRERDARPVENAVADGCPFGESLH